MARAKKAKKKVDGTDDINTEMTDPAPERMGAITRGLAVIFILGAALFWIWAFSPLARERFQAPDEIMDPAFVVDIVTTCDAAYAELDALPSPRSATDPENRANIVEDSNVVLVNMRNNIAALEGGLPEDRALITLWLADWDILIDDRMTHVERLRTEGDVRFLNTEADGIFIAERMSGFARRNFARQPELAACLPPGDL